MTDFSDELAAVATELLTEFGQSVTFKRSLSGTYVPATGTTGASTDSTWSANAYPDEYVNSEVDGMYVQQGDIKLYADVDSTNVPNTDDYVAVNSRDYRVMNVKYISVSGANVLYEIQLRI